MNIHRASYFHLELYKMKINVLFLCLITVIFFACNQDELDKPILEESDSVQAMIIPSDENQDKEEDKGKVECFKLIFPLSITLPDASVISGDEKELWEAIKAWYNSNPDVDAKPSLNYPVQVLWKDEIEKTIVDEKEMEIAKKYCDQEKKDCFQLIYPIVWIMPDGEELTMEDEKDWDAIKNWYEVHPDSDGKFLLSYPVEILLEDGFQKTIANDEEMEMVKKECK